MRSALSVIVLVSSFVTSITAQKQPADPIRAFGLDRAIPWIVDPETYVDGRRAKRNITGKLDRGAMLDRAIEKAKASGRPVMWYVYRIVEQKLRGRQMYRAPILDGYMQHVLFADDDVSNIIKNRFVPLRMMMDEAMSKRFDLRPLDFVEPAVVFLDGKGKVIHYVERFRTFNAHWFADLLRRVLEKSGAGKAVKRGTSVAQAIDEGRWEWALGRLSRKPHKTAHDHYVVATLLRRLRRLDGAQKAIAAARRAKGHLEPGVLAVEELRIRAMRGAPIAQTTYASIAASKGPRTAEGLYLYAASLCRNGGRDAARILFEMIAKDYPDDPYGRKARANVTIGNDKRPYGPTLLGWESLAQLPDAAYTGLPEDTQWSGDKLTRKAMALRAVEFLLSQQRGDGGFTDCRYAYWGSPKITTNTWVAITALAAMALHQYRDVFPEKITTARIDAAVEKAKTFMFSQGNLNRGQNEDVYADTYRLFFLAATVPGATVEQRADAIARMHGVIEEVRKRQKESGFWAHEYQNAFCSAAMLSGLLEAKKAGADVPEEMLTKGLAALLSARFKNGAYVYGGAANGPRGRRRPTSLKDASARMPVCEGTLFAFGKSDKAKLQVAFDAFWKYFDRIENVRRNDFHSDGELGGFFFFHALYHASEANKLLPSRQQADNRRRFFAVLQRIPEMDGSFIDSHELGRSYGTAMALLTLKNTSH